jgi:prevent-host-death family protein
MKTITATLASKEFGFYLDTVRREPVVITKNSRPVAITLSIEEANELFQLRIEAGIRKGLADVEAGRFQELTEKYSEDMKTRFKARHQD